jgi:hypothetical protein
MPSAALDAAMRQQVQVTLRANPAATFDAALANWGTQQGRPVLANDAERLRQIWGDVRLDLLIHVAEQAERPWWRKW